MNKIGLFSQVFCIMVLNACMTQNIQSSPGETSQPQALKNTPAKEANSQTKIERAITVIQKSKGVFLFPFEPYSDFISKREITNAEIVAEIKAILEENKKFEPEYKKRCLPKWEMGLEFRETLADKKMLLFSFDCSTMMIYEDKIYKDFEPQKIRLYGLLNYQINSSTSRKIQ